MTTIDKLRQFCRPKDEQIPITRRWIQNLFIINGRVCATDGTIIVSAKIRGFLTKNEAPSAYCKSIMGWISAPNPKFYKLVRIDKLPSRLVKWRCQACGPDKDGFTTYCDNCLGTRWHWDCAYQLNKDTLVGVNYIAKLLSVFKWFEFYPSFGKQGDAVPFRACGGITGSLMPLRALGCLDGWIINDND